MTLAIPIKHAGFEVRCVGVLRRRRARGISITHLPRRAICFDRAVRADERRFRRDHVRPRLLAVKPSAAHSVAVLPSHAKLEPRRACRPQGREEDQDQERHHNCVRSGQGHHYRAVKLRAVMRGADGRRRRGGVGECARSMRRKRLGARQAPANFALIALLWTPVAGAQPLGGAVGRHCGRHHDGGGEGYM